ncbi:MAG: bifunctional hydroxymethylpyrimidine kinase/phosphomethylpyrimidine kinase [Rhodanobacteraceae bacterium]|nr:bifunctional hydroxymethylpyrimidine kinase/phosphomethylpyrimidine kinase [Xanthomonadales bacterium]MCP5479567.1 bifunctional hydroxymethylpyrimidine kinase/phosphomethylpyrimidine kinase [Rhodanobacteraceae bacterium]HPF72223.1 bifunctional hydroxymethylpyrimidine kinase/phosphomethylpyrimidine kinase [Xanthomonadaceae bacterium]
MKKQHIDDHPICALTIAGSDSGGGAGIQADLKTFDAFDLHGLSAITALTAQNTRGVRAVQSATPALIDAQIDALFEDFDIGAVKIGMLGDALTIRTVAKALRRHQPGHVVLDPVMIATSGAALLDPEAVGTLVEHLFPLATVITPNLPEAARLLGRDAVDSALMEDAATELRRLGAPTVLLKGGHAEGPDLLDVLDDGIAIHRFTHVRLDGEGHGTGCTLASAVAAGLARGDSLAEACRIACDYVHAAFRDGYRPGRGNLVVLDHSSTRARSVVNH